MTEECRSTLEEKHIIELREKRLRWKNRQKNQEEFHERSRSRVNDNHSGRHSRKKSHKRKRIHEERRHFAHVKRRKKKRDVSSDTEEKNEKDFHIIPAPVKDPTDSEESDQMSEKNDADSELDSSDSETESNSISSHSNTHDDDDEEGGDDDNDDIQEETSKEKVEKMEPIGEKDVVAAEKKETPLDKQADAAPNQLPTYRPGIQGCRNVEEFHCENRIAEGTYGVVYRAKDKRTNEIVALKRLKMEKEKEGFPITSLREINTLMKAQHPNIVTIREVVVGSNMDKIFLVMEYVEHDLKSLMETMKKPFLIGEVKSLLLQLLYAVAHLHDNWILHRDLKTSNILLSHKGILKVGDFGLAREYGSPLKPYTPVVVTLWYRAPELLLGSKKYSTHIDMWSVGCIFGELLTMKPLFPGKSESDELQRIFQELGSPNDKIWPGYSNLPLVKRITFNKNYPYNNLKKRFGQNLTDDGFDLINRFLTYNPARRISAEKAKSHAYFNEKPKPVPPNMFPTWPSKSEQCHRKSVQSSPKPPSGGKQYAKKMDEADDESFMTGFHIPEAQQGYFAEGPGFSLKF